MGRTSNAKERLMKAVLELIWSGSYGSTTIDLICEKAGVNKGSFYYFFNSKSDLTIAALETDWQNRRLQMDFQFSPTVNPVDRLLNYCRTAYEHQFRFYRKCGHVLGCPFFSLGSEIGTCEEPLRKKIHEILDYHRRYLEGAIRDAQHLGLIKMSDPGLLSRMLFTYYEGLLTRARILNDITVLEEMVLGTTEILVIVKNQGAPV